MDYDVLARAIYEDLHVDWSVTRWNGEIQDDEMVDPEAVVAQIKKTLEKHFSPPAIVE